MTAATIQAIFRTSPFFTAGEDVYAEVPVGSSLLDIVGPDASYSASATINGYRVPREYWGHVFPKAESLVRLTNYPQGGGNGSKLLRMVALIVVAYLSYGVGTGAIGGLTGGYATAAGAAIGIAGSMLVTPLVGQAREVAA